MRPLDGLECPRPCWSGGAPRQLRPRFSVLHGRGCTVAWADFNKYDGARHAFRAPLC